jgi:hypothetical protein
MSKEQSFAESVMSMSGLDMDPKTDPRPPIQLSEMMPIDSILRILELKVANGHEYEISFNTFPELSSHVLLDLWQRNAIKIDFTSSYYPTPYVSYNAVSSFPSVLGHSPFHVQTFDTSKEANSQDPWRR